jgi:cytochrome c2
MSRSNFHIVTVSLFLAGGWLFTVGASHALDIPEDTVNGKALYDKACLLCHGEEGKGDGPVAFFIGSYSAPRPRNFTSGTFKFRSTPSGELPTDEDLFRTLTNGIPGYMPPFSRLSVKARLEIIAYMKTFSDDFLNQRPVPLTLNSPPIDETLTSINQGKIVYDRLGCATCHGSEGDGDSHFFRSGDLRDRSGLRIPATDLTQPALFKNGASPRDIARSILTGLDGTPMPSYLGTLAPDQDDLGLLVNYILSLSRAPSPP